MMAIAPVLRVAMLCVLLGGCALLTGAEAPPDTYDLPSTPVARSKGGAVGAQLAVRLPGALRSLDTDRVLVREGAGRIAYYPAAAWGDRLPKLVQARLVSSFEDAGRFRAIVTNGEGLSADLGLAVEIRAFEVRVQGGTSHAVVDFYVKMVDERRNEVLASRQFIAEVPTPKDDVVSGVNALRQAFQQVTTEMVRWTSSARMAERRPGEDRG
jgi:cholesterol transport system auxiliary component